MKKLILHFLSALALTSLITVGAAAQTDTNSKAGEGSIGAPAVAITASTSPLDLAKAAVAAQGGDKFKSAKNTILRGSVELYGPNSTQSIPGSFIIVTSGDKFRMEVDARPLFTFKQIFDGQNSYSSLPGAEMAPMNKFGMQVLRKFDEAGYTVTALPDKKKLRGFRISDADGNATDYYLDPATGRVVNFTFSFNGYNFGTENKKFKEIEGVLVPTSFTQRIEMPQGAAFAEFNAKDIKINQTVGDDVFAMPN